MSDSCCDIVHLAHLSDVHLPPPPRIAARDLINKRILSLMLWNARRRHVHLASLGDAVVADIASCKPDVIAVTGDLTNFGLPVEIESGARWLAGLPAPSVIVPGNHDRMTNLPWADGLAQWAPWMAASPGQFPYVRRVGPVCLIGVNSAIASPPFMAYGRVGQRQGERLHAILSRTRGSYRVVLIHHPPRAGLVKPRKSLLDSYKISGILQSAGAEMVLHGHSHDATMTTVPGTDIPLIGVASSSLRSSLPLRQAGWNDFSISPISKGWDVTLIRRQIDAEGRHNVLSEHRWQRHS